MSQEAVMRKTRAVRDLSDMLGCDLDDETLKLLMELLDLGVEPQPLARIVLELREQKHRADFATRPVGGNDAKRRWNTLG